MRRSSITCVTCYTGSDRSTRASSGAPRAPRTRVGVGADSRSLTPWLQVPALSAFPGAAAGGPVPPRARRPSRDPLHPRSAILSLVPSGCAGCGRSGGGPGRIGRIGRIDRSTGRSRIVGATVVRAQSAGVRRARRSCHATARRPRRRASCLGLPQRRCVRSAAQQQLPWPAAGGAGPHRQRETRVVCVAPADDRDGRCGLVQQRPRCDTIGIVARVLHRKHAPAFFRPAPVCCCGRRKGPSVLVL